MKHEISKRRQPLIRTIVYGLMTLSVLSIVTVLMFIVLGYQFNERDGRIEQGGLLQFGSIPTGATVTLDNARLGPRTNSRTNVTTGSHSVSFDREGYRTWKKTINIKAGQIGWLTYARLIPSEITPESVRTFESLGGALASPGRNYMLMIEDASRPVFTLANIQGDTVRYESLAMPETLPTQPAEGNTQNFVLESWSQNESAALVKHTYGPEEQEWLLLDRDSPERSINLSATFGINPSKIIFAGGGDKLLFVQTDGAVRRMNLDEQTLSRPLATNVTYFTEYDDKTIAYTTGADDEQMRHVGYAAVDVPEPVVLRTFPADEKPLYASMSTYFSERYVAILYGETLTIEGGEIPTKTREGSLKKVAEETVPVGSSNLSLERSSRFAVIQLPDGYATYDIELYKFDETTWALPTTEQRPLAWVDDYMLWSANGGQLRLYEFDGANQQNIMPVSEGYSVGIAPNGKYIYGFLRTDKGVELHRAQLVL
jgi:hypothetical protein